jgi:quinolinate synthase
VWFGPDTYMGRNLRQLFEALAGMSDDAVAAIHPAHTARSVSACLARLHHFQQGTCIVHEIFGGETCALLRRSYPDAYITAHLEVPGEMFTFALEAKEQRDMGVVGSTSNILSFIADKVSDALRIGMPDRLQFVLGTEAGMITSIVRKVQALLREAGNASKGIDVEIVFPVAPEAITTAEQLRGSRVPVELPTGIAIAPGPQGGEGCSLEGGCAACPYMKMNTLDALLRVCERVGEAGGEAALAPQAPRAHTETVRSPGLQDNRALNSLAQCRLALLHMLRTHFQYSWPL